MRRASWSKRLHSVSELLLRTLRCNDDWTGRMSGSVRTETRIRNPQTSRLHFLASDSKPGLPEAGGGRVMEVTLASTVTSVCMYDAVRLKGFVLDHWGMYIHVYYRPLVRPKESKNPQTSCQSSGAIDRVEYIHQGTRFARAIHQP